MPLHLFVELLSNQIHWIKCLPQDLSERNLFSLMQISPPLSFQSSSAFLDGSVTGEYARRIDNNYSNMKWAQPLLVLRNMYGQAVVAHTFNPRTLGAEAGRTL